MSHTDKNLRAIIKFLDKKMADGTLKPGQKEALKRAAGHLRKAKRSGNTADVVEAIARVVSIFLSAQSE